MVIVMQEGATEEQIQHVIDRVVASGFDVHRSTGASHTVLGAVGVHRDFDHRDFELLQGVREVVRITQPFKLASRAFKPQGTVIDLGRGVKIGGPEVVVAAGPCSVESREQILAVAEAVSKAGAKIMRAGAFKPRTSPYAFQGMGEKGLQLMREAADKFCLFVVSEVMDASQIQMMSAYVDIFQVGARNMQNYFLLQALGEVQKPVLLNKIVLHVARAHLEYINVSAHHLDLRGIHHFADDEEAEFVGSFAHQLQALFAHTLERIQRSARLERAGAHDFGPGFGNGFGNGKDLLPRFDPTRAGGDDHFGATNFHASAQIDYRALWFKGTTGEV